MTPVSPFFDERSGRTIHHADRIGALPAKRELDTAAGSLGKDADARVRWIVGIRFGLRAGGHAVAAAVAAAGMELQGVEAFAHGAPLTPDLRHQLPPGPPWIGDERGLDRGQIGAPEDELPHDAGIDEIVDRRDAGQLPVLEDDAPVDVGLVAALLNLELRRRRGRGRRKSPAGRRNCRC